MLDFGWPELLVIAIVLIVVVGPKDLPRVLRGFGRTTAKMRSMASDFRRQFDEALREAELDDVKSLADDVRKLDPRNEIKKHLSPLEDAGRDIHKGLNEAAKPKVSGNDKATAGEVPDATPAVATEPVKTAPAKPAEAATKSSGANTAKSSASKTGTKAAAPKKASPAKPVSKAKSTAAARKTSTAARGKKNVGSTS